MFASSDVLDVDTTFSLLGSINHLHVKISYYKQQAVLVKTALHNKHHFFNFKIECSLEVEFDNR